MSCRREWLQDRQTSLGLLPAFERSGIRVEAHWTPWLVDCIGNDEADCRYEDRAAFRGPRANSRSVLSWAPHASAAQNSSVSPKKSIFAPWSSRMLPSGAKVKTPT